VRPESFYSEGLIALAKGADILVCETIEPVTERGEVVVGKDLMVL